ncbi:hypothetical protein [Defluviimonas sp. SAOS-178_SWC]|uniref:hypothetical protein n=1 Tax=Defluviimonas sp. SAOS-178_SWC TaxID=3121287 RepID=UPI0032217412
MGFQDLPGRFDGLSEEGAARAAHQAAYREAIALMAFSSAEYFPNEEIITEAQRQFIDHVFAFTINARRAIEIKVVKGIQINVGRWRLTEQLDDFNPTTDLWEVINKIVHARHLKIFVNQRKSQVMQVGHEWRLTFLEVQSDRGEKIHVDPFGMAFSYVDAMSVHFPAQ